MNTALSETTNHKPSVWRKSFLKFKREIVELSLIPSSGGLFEVIADGKKVHSKKETGEFPDPAEVVAAIRRMRQNS